MSTLLASGLTPGLLRAAENGQGESGWTFLAVNDLHFHTAAECGPWFEKAVAAMKASAPQAEFCLLGGDQADTAEPAQLAGIRDAFKALGCPVHATVGNHDWTEEGSRAHYDEIFPGQLNQTWEHRGWQIIGLDSSDGPKYHDTVIHETTLQWLDQTLPKLSKAKPTIVWTHFPMGEGVKYRPGNAEQLLQRFAEYNLQAVLSGHYHGLTEKPWHNGTLVTDRCCSRYRDNHDGTRQKGWWVCTARDGKIERKFVEVPEELRTFGVAPAKPAAQVK